MTHSDSAPVRGAMAPERHGAVTRLDVARLAGVSTAVVSYVVNDGPRPVAPGTRDRVLQAIAELGYHPNGSARALRLGRTQTLALLVPAIANPFFAELAGEVQRVARASGYALHFADVGGYSGGATEQISSFVERQVDGILVIGLDPSVDFSPALSRGIPVVALDRFTHADNIPTVAINDRAAAADGVRHLVRHGHTRIAMIAGPAGTAASEARIQGWAEATGADLDDVADLVVHAEFSHAGGMTAARDLVSAELDATAVFIASDIQAVGAMRELHASGFTIPDDLAVMGFDGTIEGAYSWPPLSTVRQPLDVMAKTAFAMLTGDRQSAHHVVEHAVLVRTSCGCPPSTGA